MVLIACSLDDNGRKWPKPTRAGFNGNGGGLQTSYQYRSSHQTVRILFLAIVILLLIIISINLIDYYTVIFSFVTYWLLDLHVSFYTLPSN